MESYDSMGRAIDGGNNAAFEKGRVMIFHKDHGKLTVALAYLLVGKIDGIGLFCRYVFNLRTSCST